MNNKKLTRDLSDKWIAGVCSGLARYFNIDPLLMRFIWVLWFIAAAPFALIMYLFFVILMPASDKGTEYVTEMPDDHNPVVNEPKNETNVFLGLFLITVGLIFLFDRYFRWINWRDLWPVVLILLGVYIILQAYQGKTPTADDLIDSVTDIFTGDKDEDGKQTEGEKKEEMQTGKEDSSEQNNKENNS